MKVSNQEAIQSYVVTTAKYDFSIYEKRVLYRIIEILQSEIIGKKLNYKYEVKRDLFNDRHFIMPISCFLKDDKDKNYTQVKKALTDLRNKTFEYEDDEIWAYLGIIESPEVHKRAEFVKFRVTQRLYDAFLNFSKGFRALEIETAMKFNSIYAMRFYELFSKQEKPITYTIEYIKTIFKIENKYNKITDFERRVLIPAKKELDEKSPYSFNYKSLKTGRKITSILFTPYKTKTPTEVDKKQILLISRDFEFYLKMNFRFSDNEIQNNLELFQRAEKEIKNFATWLISKQEKVNKVKNKKGYIIQILKNKLDEK